MKQSTTNTLLVAKAIHREAVALIGAGEKHSATAGLILLQDAVELIVLSALDELDADEQRNLSSKSFDELLGELKNQSVPVVKSGTIKALNKQRILCKHYGQLSEPAAVVNYLSAADTFIDAVLNHVLDKSLSQVFLIDLVRDCPAKNYLLSAIVLSEQEKYLEALIEIRKAFYTSYESTFSVYGFRNIDKDQSNSAVGLLGMAMLGGRNAPYWAKNKQWIESNVSTPSQYVQIDHERLKLDCMEWGLSTAEIENLRRLTPIAVETETDSWHIDYETSFVPNEANLSNFNYCLDIVINFLMKKQEFESARRWPKREKSLPMPPIYIGKSIFEKPSRTAQVTHVVQEGYFYSTDRVVSGFESGEKYLYVHLYQEEEGTQNRFNHVWGYLLIEE